MIGREVMSFLSTLRLAMGAKERVNGYSFVMKPGDQARRMITLPAGRVADCDCEPLLVTVDLWRRVQDVTDTPRNQTDRDNVPGGSVDHQVAVIEWGAGRGKNKARVDFTHGQRFTIAASTLYVSAEYDGCGPPVELSASVLYGSIGANKAQYTDIPKDGPITIPPSVTSRFRPIPDFARRLTLVDNGSTNNYGVIFSPEPRPSPSQIAYIAVPAGIDQRTSVTAELTIPNGVDYYAIVNNSSTFSAIVYPVFELFL